LVNTVGDHIDTAAADRQALGNRQLAQVNLMQLY
jgi:hypothetical protein